MTGKRALLAAGTSALLGVGVAHGAASLGRATGPTTIHLRLGDYVAIPALDWTCTETILTKGGSTVLACDTNDKPISGVIIAPRKITVHAVLEPKNCPSAAPVCTTGTPAAPTRISDNRYVFVFNHG
jgi:hypothetical protein